MSQDEQISVMSGFALHNCSPEQLKDLALAFRDGTFDVDPDVQEAVLSFCASR